jgi:hypothetical protein
VLAACCVAVIASSVFWLRIWPRHATESTSSVRADCLADRTTDDDVLVATDWGWIGRVALFHRRNAVHIADLAVGNSERGDLPLALAALVEDATERGGSVFMRDLDRAPAGYLERVSRQTGLGPADWDRLVTEPAFVCGGLGFVRVTALRADDAGP